MSKGLQERPSYDLGSELRKRYRAIEEVKRQAAKALSSVNDELAAEVHFLLRGLALITSCTL